MSHDFSIEPVFPDQLPATWAIFLPFIEKYIGWKKEADSNAYLRMCLNSDAQLWAVFDKGVPTGALITEVRKDTQTGKEGLVGLILGGNNGRKWGPVVWEYLCEKSKELGYVKLTFEGRKGWGRVLGKKPVAYRYEECFDG